MEAITMFKASEVLAGRYDSANLDELFKAVSDNYIVDEEQYLSELIKLVPSSDEAIERVTRRAHELVNKVRQFDKKGLMVGIDAFLQQYSLETQEGIILMCLAEALLRIPDAATADALIEDKLSGAKWDEHMSKSDSVLVNASTWGLMLTGKIVKLDKKLDGTPSNLLSRLVNRLGEPVIRQAMMAAMKIMGKQFVLGRNMKEALKNSEDKRKLGYTHSYDMLGEAALTRKDAEKYYTDYANAITELGAQSYNENESPRPTISIKLSALHPRYEVANEDRVLTELYDTVIRLIKLARGLNIGISIDAEEVDRLELSLKLFQKLFNSEATKGWGLLGIVVQAYSKRALPVLVWLTRLAKNQGDEIPVRLVKGAYWDSELKWAQQAGEAAYPLYTRKAGTDVSYLACARYLLSDATRGAIYPQFASHNAQTVAAISDMAGDRNHEFQRLHGMGQELYDTILAEAGAKAVRIYAPIGAHKDLLPYLVRRLLENGANTSFVHKLVDPKTPIESLVVHPLTTLTGYKTLANNRIVLPADIFGSERKNSKGLNMNIISESEPFFAALEQFKNTQWQAGPLVNGKTLTGEHKTVVSPYDTTQTVGQVAFADKAAIEAAVASAEAAFTSWARTPVETRASALQKLADLLEENREELIALCTREAGKSIQDGIDEVREAVDFCRYYAVQAKKMMAKPELLPGPTGELNELFLQGRGVFVCISPWNFPLAIFLGQVSAALAAGNTVIAKPAEQTSIIGYRAVQLAHQAGIPVEVLQFLPGTGATVGSAITADERIGGVCFTGSTGTAKLINRTLANREGAIIPLIAETGGQNAMVVDSTSQPEQVVNDVVSSSFTSAGQRCSALRVLFLQEDIADRVIEVLQGAMDELVIGNPSSIKTDVGPVIDATAKANLDAHIDHIKQVGKLIKQMPLPAGTENGHFVSPTAVEIDSIKVLEKEHFGPILHVIRYKAAELSQVINEINSTGFGLTLGIHSRNEGHALEVADKVNVGNVYINRNQIGAVVGVQPFGGQGLSGTGPKAGGPHYLTRFVTEKTRTNNITAIGGNATLLSLGDSEE
ncbi:MULTISPECIES: bifunctional proline dehydrogenase/L-glutamate gamma-semialdehyde dehydrogenase PutA [unclassified Shewanella]|uniref:bifunctional proline dehydrogenase/L-glutamate gamma-semialdehyde dehydrogenase PutA n=1 Tax=unclassified Shewanella TaxID=196818 RepID=UPI0021DA13E5|nr:MULTISPECIES: bifunctional proline dehydrogenase/L-glutamate gamma-semialdehyde dehydrogenase PutA [unclassified Shewanella]MCU7986015.1 bifunctional proline dehydrogenase/L-glutamate gamma-semialdehyde dehydrogenase PutA [Shewanella sp. SW24]MCU8002008.1 bifunctional proline dehydrogenase/L-glutamate gamma-semialdehyde dehydrogenase PutA [Shewanella sp. SM96]MCU8060441.1 bifunctional proline dehydrogenase/L-glutamate gamma-semialdehyde dehydrogenase PutA [Shewanella sp. SM55]MCU8068193.1 bi